MQIIMTKIIKELLSSFLLIISIQTVTCQTVEVLRSIIESVPVNWQGWYQFGDDFLSPISQQLVNVRLTMDKRFTNLKSQIDPAELKTCEQWLEPLLNHLNYIDDNFKRIYAMVVSKEDKFNEANLSGFAHNLLDNRNLLNKVDEIRTYFTLESPKSLMSKILLILETYDEEKSLCGTGHSSHDFLYSIYSVLQAAEIKAYLMDIFSHEVLEYYKAPCRKPCKQTRGYDLTSIIVAHNNLRKNLVNYKVLFLEAMEKLSREFRACDRGGFVRDKTFFELEGAVQFIIQLHSTYDLGQLRSSKDTCESINVKSGPAPQYCSKDSHFCAMSAERPCFGGILDCQLTTGNFEACLAKKRPRRYKWIGTNWKHKHPTCDPENRVKIISSGETPCVCQCNDNHIDSHSTHLINLQPVESDVAENMVITGVKFIVHQRILQLQIQQGKLGINGKIDNVHWKPINDISEKIRAARLEINLRGEVSGVEENKDFLIITKHVNTYMDLDTSRVENGYVLTGVKFSLVKNPDAVPDRRIKTGLSARKFNLATGELILDFPAETIESTTFHSERYHFDRSNVNQPTFPTVPVTGSDNYVIIDSSHVEDDSGQTTLPYFDAIPVVSDPPSPLGGFGIFHKTKDDFTGFVSLKLISLNFTHYMETSNFDQIFDNVREFRGKGRT